MYIKRSCNLGGIRAAGAVERMGGHKYRSNTLSDSIGNLPEILPHLCAICEL